MPSSLVHMGIAGTGYGEYGSLVSNSPAPISRPISSHHNSPVPLTDCNGPMSPAATFSNRPMSPAATFCNGPMSPATAAPAHQTMSPAPAATFCNGSISPGPASFSNGAMSPASFGSKNGLGSIQNSPASYVSNSPGMNFVPFSIIAICVVWDNTDDE